jgi:hypothetical protein
MLIGNIKLNRTDYVRPRRRGSTGKIPSHELLECGKLDWEPWPQDDPDVSLVPSDENMAAAAEASRTAHSIMQLTKSQLIGVRGEAGFDDFVEVVANLANTAQMLRAVIEMIEGAHGRMIYQRVPACKTTINLTIGASVSCEGNQRAGS